VLLHLLAETAIGDSAGYQILPFEEVEDLKREHEVLSNRVESTKRKLALETKLRDAAKSLSRLPNQMANGNGEYTNGATNGDTNGIAHHHEDDGFAVSSQKCEQLSQELWALERRAQDVHKRLLEHTAGILQLTHRGLKKNVNRSSTNHVPNGTAFDFDDRSLYKALEIGDSHGLTADIDTLRSTEQKLEELNERLRDIILHSHADRDVNPLPLRVNNDTSLTFIQDHLAYLENSLETLQVDGLPGAGPEPVPEPGLEPGLELGLESEFSATEIGTELSAINARLQNLLGQAGSHLSPTLPPPPSPSGEYLSGHMDYLRSGMDDLQGRVERLQDQKSILTTQIQQQRELNSKSDAEKDAHVADLAQELVETRKQFELSEREVEAVRGELGLVIEQLDATKQQQGLQDQQLEIDKARAEKEAERLREELGLVIEQLDATKQQQGLQDQQLEIDKAKAEKEAERLREELMHVEGEYARAQTELTVVKAELDGAYGTRAERAAEAAASPALYKEIEDLNARNISLAEELSALRADQTNRDNGQGDLQKRVETLQKELAETIEDYESMTKASIEFEKERERYESTIDSFRDRCEQLETQLSDERITWMGVNQTQTRDGATETTSTMVLKNEFKKMMRDTRAENLKLLRVSPSFPFCTAVYQ
jgi:Up-regulated During Septation